MKAIEKAAEKTGKVRLPEFSPMEYVHKVDGVWAWCEEHGGAPAIDCLEIHFEDYKEWESYLGFEHHQENL